MPLSDEEHRRDAIKSIKTIEQRLGVTLQDVLLSKTLSHDEKLKRARRLIVKGLNDNVFKQADGYKPILEDDVELEPNVVFSQHNARILRSYAGSKTRDAVLKIRKTLENLSSASSDAAFVAQTLGGAVVAVGIKFLVQLGKGLFIGFPLNVALKTAVTTIGLNFAIATVLLAVLALILYFAFLTDRNMLGIIINDTDIDWICPNWRDNVDGYSKGNLYMDHGKMSNFPSDNKEGDFDSPEIQIKKRVSYDTSPTPENIWVSTGMYYAEKKAGFFGAEGVAIFTPYEEGADGFAVQFSVPYSAANRANIDVNVSKTYNNKDDIEKVFGNLYNNAGTDIVRTVQGRTYTSHIQGSSGSAVCGIHCVSSAPLLQASAGESEQSQGGLIAVDGGSLPEL